MTGAPKKRSVELLQDIEGRERGVYSGVCGYWCVGGGGDWAVIIRSCFRYNDGDDIHLEDDNIHSNGNGSSHLNGNGASDLNGNGASHLDDNGSSHLNRNGASRLNGNGSYRLNDLSDLSGNGASHLNGNGASHFNGNGASHLNGNGASHLDDHGTSYLNGSDTSYLKENHYLNSDNHFHLNGQKREQMWTLGAGGAITALSDPVAEWEEMRVKLGSVGRAFGIDGL